MTPTAINRTGAVNRTPGPGGAVALAVAILFAAGAVVWTMRDREPEPDPYTGYRLRANTTYCLTRLDMERAVRFVEDGDSDAYGSLVSSRRCDGVDGERSVHHRPAEREERFVTIRFPGETREVWVHRLSVVEMAPPP